MGILYVINPYMLRSEDDFTLPMGDPDMGLAYDIGVNGLEQNKP